MRNQHRAELCFQFLRLGDVLLAGEFDACLDLPDRHRGQEQFIGGHLFNPPNRRLRRWPLRCTVPAPGWRLDDGLPRPRFRGRDRRA